jgi:hypothetical protein
MILPALLAAAMICSSLRSTSPAMGSTLAPLLSAMERSAGPRNSASIPGVAAIASTLSRAVCVSIMANVSVSSLASRK